MGKALNKPGRYGDGGTLYLVVAPGGSKSWVQRLTITGRRRDLGLGGFPLVTLAEAREQAFDNSRQARRGRDPLSDRRRFLTPTFEQAAGRALEANRARWRNAKTAANWTESMAKHAYPVFGVRRVDQIGREDVLRVLTPIWRSKPELAPQGPPAHPRHAAMGGGSRPPRAQHGGRGHRRRAARDARRGGALPGAALWGGRARSRAHRSVPGVAVGEGVPALRGAHRLPVGGGAGRGMGRGRSSLASGASRRQG